MSNLPERIKLLRKEKKLTQSEFGKIFGIAKSTVSMYENGNSSPDDELKIKIADHFNVSVDYLLGRTDERGGFKYSASEKKSFALKENFGELPQEALDQIDEYIRFLKFKYKDK
ncbi:MAG: helix-turn-helix domain-containing protein [Tissierellales bacterium]|jgi:transcriptional regulator with XRE-family HTH domain|nr:helix-turn-helix domain-containing protein [Tissierellales bacterium]